MPKTTITVDTPIEDCGISCPHFKISKNTLLSWGTYSCENYLACESALYQAGVLKDADDEEEQ